MQIFLDIFITFFYSDSENFACLGNFTYKNVSSIPEVVNVMVNDKRLVLLKC